MGYFKPTSAMVLSMIGGAFYLLIGAGIAMGSLPVNTSISINGQTSTGVMDASLGYIGLVSGVIMILGALLMNTTAQGRVRIGSALVLVFVLVGAAFTLGGFGIGFLLALIGSIMGLRWKAPPATGTQ